MKDQDRRVLGVCLELLAVSRPGVHPRVEEIATRAGVAQEAAGASLNRLATRGLVGVISVADFPYPIEVHEVTPAGRRLAAFRAQ